MGKYCVMGFPIIELEENYLTRCPHGRGAPNQAVGTCLTHEHQMMGDLWAKVCIAVLQLKMFGEQGKLVPQHIQKACNGVYLMELTSPHNEEEHPSDLSWRQPGTGSLKGVCQYTLREILKVQLRSANRITFLNMRSARNKKVKLKERKVVIFQQCKDFNNV